MAADRMSFGPLVALQEVVSPPFTVGQAFDALLMVLLEAAIVALATVVVLRVVRSWAGHAMVRARVAADTRILILRAASIAIIVFGIVVVLGILGVSPATLLAAVGAVGIAFGLAVQDILKNFFSGIYLLLERPFRVGDVIKVKDQQGTVIQVGVRTTTLLTAENVQVMVPNAVVFAEVVSNLSFGGAQTASPSAEPGGAADVSTASSSEPPATAPR